MDHSGGTIVPPFERETGVLVRSVYADRGPATGEYVIRTAIELRLHLRPDGAAYELRSWRLTERGEWICANVPWMSAADWLACGRALEAVPCPTT